MIRNDLIEEFAIYVSKVNLKLSAATVKMSIFETNNFLLKNKPTLIEYATFYGSFQIFKFLQLNNVELTPSLWLYAIHGGNADIIHVLEENQVKPPKENEKKFFKKCLIESIKCHHNDFAKYIEENFEIMNDDDIISKSFKYHNYSRFHSNFEKCDNFFYVCLNNFNKLVNFLMNEREENIIERMINNIIYFQIKFSKKLVFNSILIFFFFFNIVDINDAADKNDTEIIYYLLSKQELINEFDFTSNKNLKRIAIPPSITSISENSFKWCSSLKEVSIPLSVTSIGTRAFYGCSSLEKITISPFVRSIREFAFCECKSLKKLHIPFSVESIGYQAFQDCSSLEDVTLPPNLTQIKCGLFENCTSLKQLFIPPSVNLICSKAFNKCSLKKLIISSLTIEIDKNAFDRFHQVEELVIPFQAKKLLFENQYKNKIDYNRIVIGELA